MENVTGMNVVVKSLVYQVLRLIACQLCHSDSRKERRTSQSWALNILLTAVHMHAANVYASNLKLFYFCSTLYLGLYFDHLFWWFLYFYILTDSRDSWCYGFPLSTNQLNQASLLTSCLQRWVWSPGWPATWTCCYGVWSQWYHWGAGSVQLLPGPQSENMIHRAPCPSYTDALSGSHCSGWPEKQQYDTDVILFK